LPPMLPAPMMPIFMARALLRKRYGSGQLPTSRGYSEGGASARDPLPDGGGEAVGAFGDGVRAGGRGAERFAGGGVGDTGEIDLDVEARGGGGGTGRVGRSGDVAQQPGVGERQQFLGERDDPVGRADDLGRGPGRADQLARD